jgi:hypothetical protein
MGQDRWASWVPTDPQEDRLKNGERAVRQRQKRTDTDKQEDRVLTEKKKKKKNLFPSSGERETPTLLGPSERANFNHWTTYISIITAI